MQLSQTSGLNQATISLTSTPETLGLVIPLLPHFSPWGAETFFKLLLLGNIRGINGTASSPTLSFTADTNTGIYSGGSDILKLSTAGSDRLAILSSGNVGIGDTSPASLLTVGSGDLFRIQSTGEARGVGGSASSPSFSFTADTNTGIYRGGADTLRFSTGGSDRMTINSSGNVGIGTTSPAQKLDVAGTVQMTGFKMTTGPSSGYVLTADSAGVGAWKQVLSGEGNTDSIAKFSSALGITPSSIFESSQNIGIGLSVPSSRLHIAANDQSTSLLTLEQQSPGLENALEFLNVTHSGFRFVQNPNDHSLEIRKVLPIGIIPTEELIATAGGIAGIGLAIAQSDFSYCLLAGEEVCYDFVVGEPIEAPTRTQGEVIAFDDGQSVMVMKSGDGAETIVGSESDYGFLGTASNHAFEFLMNNSVELFLDTDGRVGIGGGFPDATLHIQKSSTSSFPAVFIADEISAEGDVAWPSDQDLNLGTWNQSTDTFTEYMRIEGSAGDDGGGNVGIGAINPGSRLTVDGSMEIVTGGLIFSDGTIQATAPLQGAPGEEGGIGETGDPGESGSDGAIGPAGPPVDSVAICSADPSLTSCGLVCGALGVLAEVPALCEVTADTGSCALVTLDGYCCVCG